MSLALEDLFTDIGKSSARELFETSEILLSYGWRVCLFFNSDSRKLLVMWINANVVMKIWKKIETENILIL